MTTRSHALALALLLAAPFAGPERAQAAEQTLRLEPSASKVTFELPATGHTVRGQLTLVSGEVRFDATTGQASGQIVIDAKSAKTGNGSRDKKLHGEVLESARFPTFTFTAERLEGTVAAAGESRVTLHGKLTIHGAEHPFALPAKITVTEGRLTAKTQFAIPFVDWGMEDPSVLFLRVEKSVAVTVDAQGRLESPAAARSSR
jgi:polyisoprenoid-binding protein YceI